MIAMFGPPRRYWTMRFEGLHQYFKSLVQETKNFINLPYTLAKRFQYLQASHLSSSNFLSKTTDIHVAECSATTLASLFRAIAEELKVIGGLSVFDDEELIHTAVSLEYICIKYSVGSIVMVDMLQTEYIPLYMLITHSASEK